MEHSQPSGRTPRRGNPGFAAKCLSVRFTAEEKANLTARAGATPLSTFIRDTLLEAATREPRRRRRSPVADQEALARVLAALGQSRLSSNLNQLARATNVGALEIDAETTSSLQQAMADIAEIRALLMRALGYADGAGQ